MKKTGFTIAEILVAICVIGVVAAITVPTLQNVMPDKKKLQVLKAYKALVDINAELVNNPSLYPGDSGATDCIGLQCRGVPFPKEDYQPAEKYSNDQKYVNLLKKNMDTVSESSSEGVFRFETRDGVK